MLAGAPEQAWSVGDVYFVYGDFANAKVLQHRAIQMAAQLSEEAL